MLLSFKRFGCGTAGKYLTAARASGTYAGKMKNERGKAHIKFLIWPSIIISIVGSILLTLILNIII
jgi:hypothetical protein